MAFSYTNPGGSGDRTDWSQFAVTSQFIPLRSGTLDKLFNGNTISDPCDFNRNQGNYTITFDFYTPRLFDQFRFIQTYAASQGLCYIEWSDNGSSWTIGSASFALGAAAVSGDPARSFTEVDITETSPHRYWRVRQYNGLTQRYMYQLEIEFRIDDGTVAAAADPYLQMLRY